MYIHRGLVAHICVGDLCRRWFGLRAFRMNRVKSLAKPTLTYCQLGMCEQPSLKIVLKYNNLHLRKCIWKSRNLTLFLLQYVNILRNVTQSFRRWVWGATWRHETGEQWVMWWPGSWTAHCFDPMIQCVLIIIIIDYSFIYSFISIRRDPTLIHYVLISIIIDYLLASSWN